MRFWYLAPPFLLLLLTGCLDPLGQINSDLPTHLSLPNTARPYLRALGSNTLTVTVGGDTGCGKFGYINEPCTSITLCVPGTNQCQTISDLLVDTGSVGLRIFSSVITLPLAPLKDTSQNTFAECAQFGTGSSWGPLVNAGVVLGSEPEVTIPIQSINHKFPGVPDECADSDVEPQFSGYNGILGLGYFHEDCGDHCARDATTRVYYSCLDSACKPVTMPSDQQLQNPISGLPSDQNGLILALPSIDPGGSDSVSGVLILGIGSRSNNSPMGVASFPVDSRGNFTGILNGKALANSFIDSGSNGLYFPNLLNIPMCSKEGPINEFYCPNSLQNLIGYNISSWGDSQAAVPFSVSNAELLAGSKRLAFNNLAGSASEGFDWGLPFFFGRAVMIGIENRESSLGRGPYVAY